ncbi:MAG: cupin domain-containing protein [Candidatus Thorarchaeota archaeon]|nr:MAG: cupin domain-containing protein [Candidatus Thorarchaeota archaeon]
MRKRVYDVEERDLKATRPSHTEGIMGVPLIPEGVTKVTVTLTQVAPGGKFTSHRDDYHHVFYFISGHGKGWIGDEAYEIKPRRAVEVPAGELHGYENTSDQTIQLVTINIPLQE